MLDLYVLGFEFFFMEFRFFDNNVIILMELEWYYGSVKRKTR